MRFIHAVWGIPLVIFLIFPLPVFAIEEFSTAIVSTYAVASDGKTNVDQRVTLTNLTADRYASEYTLVIAGENLANLVARDALGNIVHKITKQNGQTFVELRFNMKTYGKGRKLTFRVTYQSDELAKTYGRIWKVVIPALPESSTIQDYTAILEVAPELPETVIFKPLPSGQAQRRFIWAKDKLTRVNAVGYFGASQYFIVNFNYQLNNSSLRQRQEELILPPDTSFQRVIVKSLQPQPVTIKADQEGNWRAIYNLRPRSKLDVAAELAIETFIRPRGDYSPLLDESERQLYLKSQLYWEVDNAELKQLADKLSTPRAIYRYVTKKLSYNNDKLAQNIGRLGALKTLADTNNAVCTEFTDLFITLARAAGIPAREVNGYAFTEEPSLQPLSLVENILHAWPEYYDTNWKIWRPIDPTWENTTGGIDYFTLLDFDHISFTIHGLSSTEPLLPEYFLADSETRYRTVPGEQQTQNFSVNFATEIPAETDLPLTLQLDFPATAYAQQPIKGYLTIANPNNTARYNLQPNIRSSHLSFSNEMKPIEIIPPYGAAQVELTLSETASAKQIFNQIEASYNGRRATVVVRILPWWSANLPVIAKLLLLGALSLAIYEFVIKRKEYSNHETKLNLVGAKLKGKRQSSKTQLKSKK